MKKGLSLKKNLRIAFSIVFFSVFTSFIFLIFSCGSKTDYRISVDENPSLRNKITYMDNKAKWTESLDTTLEEDKSEADKVSSKELFSQIAFAQKKYKEIEEADRKKATVLPAGFSENSVLNRIFIPKNIEMPDSQFPEIKNFGSLDTREVDDKIFELVEKFVSSINKKELDMSCVSESSKFLKPVFEYDFALLGNVDSFIVGKPFVVKNESVNEYQLPVRLIIADSHCDTILFLVNKGGKYYIEQVYYRGFYDE